MLDHGCHSVTTRSTPDVGLTIVACRIVRMRPNPAGCFSAGRALPLPTGCKGKRREKPYRGVKSVIVRRCRCTMAWRLQRQHGASDVFSSIFCPEDVLQCGLLAALILCVSTSDRQDCEPVLCYRSIKGTGNVLLTVEIRANLHYNCRLSFDSALPRYIREQDYRQRKTCRGQT